MENTRLCPKNLLRRLGRDDDGAIAILFALMLPLVLAAIGMGVEVGNWYAAKRELQSAADAAALAAAIEKYNGSSNSTVTSEATIEAQRNGFSGTPTVNIPPTSGSYTGDSLAVEVKLSKTISTMFVKYLLAQNSVTSTARAVAKMKMRTGNGCVLSLNGTTKWTAEFSGNVTIALTNCDVIANSTHDEAIRANGSVSVTADCIRTAGGYVTSGGAALNASGCGGVQTGSKKYADPYEDRTIESYSTTCDASHTNKSITSSGTYSLTPGVYCGGITASGNNTINLASGTYIMHNGAFNISGGGAITGNNVTIILAGSSASNVGNIDFTGTRTTNLSAPTSGNYSGMLFYQSDSASSSGTNRITGSNTFNITGAVYAPNREISFSGNAGGGSNCVQLVGDTVEFNGNTGMNGSNCNAAGVTLSGAKIPTLVE